MPAASQPSHGMSHPYGDTSWGGGGQMMQQQVGGGEAYGRGGDGYGGGNEGWVDHGNMNYGQQQQQQQQVVQPEPSREV